MAAFGLSIPVFFATPYGWGVWIGVPLARSWWVRLRKASQARAGRGRAAQPGNEDRTG
jgi:hypothetical protein